MNSMANLESEYLSWMLAFAYERMIMMPFY